MNGVIPMSGFVGGGGGGTPWHYWVAEAGIAYGANPASFGTRNGHGFLSFDDTTSESIVFQGMAHTDLSDSSDLTFTIHWGAATATSGDVKWDVQFEHMELDTLDIDSDSFATAQSVTDTAPGTSGFVTNGSITFTNAQADGITAGSPFRILISRDTGVGGNMTGDAQLYRITLGQ